MNTSRDKVKNLRVEIPNKDLEFAHIIPRYRNGTMDDSNVAALTKVEHALQHQLVAESCKNWQDAKRNYSAVSLIVARMKPEEKAEFDIILSKHEQTRRR